MVREERSKLNMTQQQLAAQLSVSRQTVFAVETGKYVPSTILALKIAGVFKKCVEEIFILENGD
jgi:putative transcriptional regulator